MEEENLPIRLPVPPEAVRTELQPPTPLGGSETVRDYVDGFGEVPAPQPGLAWRSPRTGRVWQLDQNLALRPAADPGWRESLKQLFDASRVQFRTNLSPLWDHLARPRPAGQLIMAHNDDAWVATERPHIILHLRGLLTQEPPGLFRHIEINAWELIDFILDRDEAELILRYGNRITEPNPLYYFVTYDPGADNPGWSPYEGVGHFTGWRVCAHPSGRVTASPMRADDENALYEQAVNTALEKTTDHREALWFLRHRFLSARGDSPQETEFRRFMTLVLLDLIFARSGYLIPIPDHDAFDYRIMSIPEETPVADLELEIHYGDIDQVKRLHDHLLEWSSPEEPSNLAYRTEVDEAGVSMVRLLAQVPADQRGRRFAEMLVKKTGVSARWRQQGPPLRHAVREERIPLPENAGNELVAARIRTRWAAVKEILDRYGAHTPISHEGQPPPFEDGPTTGRLDITLEDSEHRRDERLQALSTELGGVIGSTIRYPHG